MAVTPLKMLLFLGGASGAAAGTAYVAGVFDPLLNPQQPAALVSSNAVPEPPKPEAPAQQAALEPEPAKPAAEPPAAEAPKPVLPTFDVLRVEPNGSVVIAGHAAPDASVDVLFGDRIVASAKATPEGDFVAIPDESLKPGDYQLALRAVAPGGETLLSGQTALLSIPDAPKGEVLAMVEEAGAPSRIMVKPAAPVAEASAPEPVASPPVAAVAPQVAPQPAPQTPPAPQVIARAAIEAVEVDGDKLFVAGAAPAGAPVRIYANDELIGETRATPEGRFLLERPRGLAVGDYRIRADVVAGNGAEVLARAEVDFTRDPGEAVAAATPMQPTEESAVPVAADAPTKLKSVASGVIIRRGDSLWRISRRVYGQGVRFSTIYLANNAQIRNPNRIYPGQVFRVPEKTEQGETADMKRIGDQATTVE